MTRRWSGAHVEGFGGGTASPACDRSLVAEKSEKKKVTIVGYGRIVLPTAVGDASTGIFQSLTRFGDVGIGERK